VANTTIVFGVILIVLGLAGYFGSGMASITALIPALFGVLLAALGAISRNPERRKLAMHVAVTVGVLGFLGSLSGLFKLGTLISGGPVERPMAVAAQSAMAVLMAIFVGMCVKSFIDARRNRADA
jgi:hypothetical protein